MSSGFGWALLLESSEESGFVDIWSIWGLWCGVMWCGACWACAVVWGLWGMWCGVGLVGHVVCCGACGVMWYGVGYVGHVVWRGACGTCGVVWGLSICVWDFMDCHGIWARVATLSLYCRSTSVFPLEGGAGGRGLQSCTALGDTRNLFGGAWRDAPPPPPSSSWALLTNHCAKGHHQRRSPPPLPPTPQRRGCCGAERGCMLQCV